MLKQVSVHGGHEWYAVGGMDGEVGMVREAIPSQLCSFFKHCLNGP